MIVSFMLWMSTEARALRQARLCEQLLGLFLIPAFPRPGEADLEKSIGLDVGPDPE